jgi:LysR family transcriptional regulator, glycine cleavage system transcriptional activator
VKISHTAMAMPGPMQHLPPLEAVRIFEAVARRGSAVAAADELGLTHGAVSKRMRTLESRLGTALLGHGRGGRLVPTEAGEQLAAAARQALGLLAEAAALARGDDTRRRAIRISTTSSIAALWLVPRLHRFRARYPAFEPWVYEGQALVEPTAASGVDLGLRMGRGRWPGVKAEPLMEDVLMPVCSHSVAARLRQPADLAGVVLLHDEDPAASWWRWTQAAGLGRPAWASRGPRLAAVFLLLQAAAAGDGVALVPARLAERYLADGRVTAPFAVGVGLGTAYWLVRPARGATSPPVRAFTTWLRTEVQGH